MKQMITITITAILILALLSAPVIATGREDLLSRFTQKSTSFPTNDRLAAYNDRVNTICPGCSCQETSIPNFNAVDLSKEEIDSLPIEAGSLLSQRQSEIMISSFIANRTGPATSVLNDTSGKRTDFFNGSPVLRKSTNYLPGWLYPGDMISEVEAIDIALSNMEAAYTCPVQLKATSARLGTSALVYTPSRPWWYIDIEGNYVNPAGCSGCWGYADKNGNIAGYGCTSVGGSVVIDAITGEVQMVSKFL
jgi:hypothetical protein